MTERSEHVDGHAGEQAVAAMRGFGVDVMFTLNGGHIWPLYEAARNQGVRVVDTRHEQSATFAAEAYAKLTRRPGVAALTAGPGITNGVSAVTSAWFNGSPLVVLGGRAPQRRWGAGSLQELDHVPILQSITKQAATVTDPAKAGVMVHEADRPGRRAAPRAGVPRLPARRLRPVGGRRAGRRPGRRTGRRARSRRRRPPRRAGRRRRAAGVHRRQRRVLGRRRGRSWPRPSSTCGCRCSPTGSVAGTLPADHELAFLRTRGLLKQRADVVVVLGTPLDFRLGFGRFGVGDGGPRRRRRRRSGPRTSTC